jgi:hypothetical protein
MDDTKEPKNYIMNKINQNTDIIAIMMIFSTYYFLVPNYNLNNNRLLPLMLISVIVFFILINYIGFTFLYRSTYYNNYLKKCDNYPSNKFCHIKKIDLKLPDEYFKPLLDISYKYGNRIKMPQKSQKAISLKYLTEVFPPVVEWYKSLPSYISSIIGEKVVTTPLNQPISLCLIVYEEEGDFIDWHFDTNHYDGRFFTLLIPVTFEKTCGNYQYKNSKEQTETLDLEKGDALLFEGDKVFHRGKKLCKNQRRVILSATFTTSQKLPIIESMYQYIKTVGFFGEI